MCYAIPGKIHKIMGNIAVIDYFGEQRSALNDIEDLQVGDFVIAQGGVLVEKISEQTGLLALSAWKEAFFSLREKDESLAKPVLTGSARFLEILDKANKGIAIDKTEAIILLNGDPHERTALHSLANSMRMRTHGNSSCVHAIIEFSNYCNKSCSYCGISSTMHIDRYRMTIQEIISAVRLAKKEGFHAIVLQSGEDPWYDDEKICNLVLEIRALGMLIFLSIGMREKATYDLYYAAGARGVLLRFETANHSLFSSHRPGTSLAERFDLIKYLKNKGYVTATGFLIGLPGETDADLIANIFTLRDLKPDMWSFGPFIPAKGTKLEQAPVVSKERILDTIAISRLIEPDANILVTTALESLDAHAKKEGLLAGANSLMITMTPKRFRKKYAIYDKKNAEIHETVNLLMSLGRAPTDLGIHQ